MNTIPRYFNSLTQSNLFSPISMGTASQPCLDPTLIHFVFDIFIIKPILFSSVLHKSTSSGKSRTEIDNKIKSSAYINEFTQCLLRKQPILLFPSFASRSSTKIAKSEGERIPPCLTPARSE